MLQQKITKAVIPVAGLGTRFLPVTKVVPKELLPIVDKPALQYIIEEAVNSGLTDIILVTSPLKSLIEDHFTSETMYDQLLKERGKSHLLKDLHDLNDKINIHTVIQDKPLGLGHAVLCAKEAVGSDWFMVFLPDMLIDSKVPCAAQMINVWNDLHKPIIATERATKEMIPHYGILGVEPMTSFKKLYKVTQLVEKPKLEDAPSDFAIMGRYLLSSKVFDCLENLDSGAGKEIQLTDALIELAKSDGMYGYEYDGILHDTGDKLGYLKANLHYAMKNGQYNRQLKQVLI